MIPYSRQDITQADIDAVIAVLNSDFLTQGSMVPHFEQIITKRVNAKYAIAVNSATSALHIACLALGVGPDDLLWTVPNTFVASANCGRYCGADVDFVDIDPSTWNMSVQRLKEKLAQAKVENRLPKILVPVHFSGQPTEQEAIWELAQEYGFKIIEDASHAIGGARNKEPVGSCRWSDITIFSFHPVKIITTGEGGLALTNDKELSERMTMLRSHGITRDEDKFIEANNSPWYYEQQTLGFNYRMTDIQAGLGVSQITRLEDYIERRNELADRYNLSLKELPIQLPKVRKENYSAYHLYVVRLRLDELSKSHQQIFEELRSNGIGVNLHYMPVHLQPYYRNLGFELGDFPEAEAHGKEAITLPLYPTMSNAEQDQVIFALEKVLS